MTSEKQSKLRFLAPDWPVSIREAAIVVLITIAAATVTWVSRDNRLPLIADRDFYELELSAPLVDIPGAIALFNEGNYLFIDTRSSLTLEDDTIPGAFTIRALSLNDDLYELADTVYPEDPVILFGNGDLSGVAHVADLLLARGFEDILIMRGDLASWRNQGGETSPSALPSLSDREGES
ncbi:MAG: rhodanese-like domain-containing protein [Gemmatimonadales bacterium]|nr:rhodanese-like domain-containing protein [Gemmatimonadales bacterium]